MRSYRRQISLGIFTAAAAGLTWAAATGSVENFPATLQYTINLPGETITKVILEGVPVGGGGSAANRTVNGPFAGPFPGPLDLLVNGGDPDDLSDPGINYVPWLYAYFDVPGTTESYLRIARNAVARVDNQAPDHRHAVVPVSFSYSAVRRLNVSVNVIGAATIDSFSLEATALLSGLQHYAWTRGNGSSLSTLSSWIPMAPVANVSLYGSVNLRLANGTITRHQLTTQLRDATAGNPSVSWTIDLTALGHVEGDISIAAKPAGSTLGGYRVYYLGVSSATSGVSGSFIVPISSPHYALDLVPGDYDFYINTTFNNPFSYSDTPRRRVTVAATGTTINNVVESYGKVRRDVTVGGFYTLADLYGLTSIMQITGSSLRASGNQRVGNGVEYVMSFGSWKPYYTLLQLYNPTATAVPLNNQIYRNHYYNRVGPPYEINSPSLTSVGADSVTLIRTTVYFGVEEPPNTSPFLISNPKITAMRSQDNGNLVLAVYASGSPEPREVSAFTVVAEPGVYSLNATGIVNGQTTTFGRAGATLTFGTPVTTPPSPPQQPGGPPPPPVHVPLADQDTGSHLRVSIDFQRVGGSGGVTTLVENPLGPEPPAGYRLACAERPDAQGCAPIYYDLNTNADWSSSAKLCVRRRSTLPNGNAEDLLKLFRYSAASWRALPPPADGSPAFTDCLGDLAACGCTSEADCGIELGDDYLINAYMICGEIDAASMTSFTAQASAAPQLGTFAILQGD